jgi:hypothetical protein
MFIPLLILERAGSKTEGEGLPVVGRQPPLRQRESLLRRKILGQLQDCFESLYCDSKVLLNLSIQPAESRTLDLTIAAVVSGALSGRVGRLKRKNALGA